MLGRIEAHGTGTDSKKTGLFYLYSALRFNSTIKSFAQQLAENGKTKIVIIGAVMRKMVHIMYGVIKSEQEFNPAYAIQKYQN